MATAVEQLARGTVEFVGGAGNRDFFANVTAFAGLAPQFIAARKELKGKTDEEQKQVIETAIDALVGTEENALVGPNGSVYKFQIPIIDASGTEKLTDIVGGLLAEGLAKVV